MRLTTTWSFRWLVLIAMVTVGCSSGIAPQMCDAEVTLDASSEDDARLITWTPECVVSELHVYEGGSAIWALVASGGLRPPLVYGSAPQGGESVAGPAEVQVGVEYTVILGIQDPEGVLLLGPFPISF